jgi:hypothetical protein
VPLVLFRQFKTSKHFDFVITFCASLIPLSFAALAAYPGLASFDSAFAWNTIEPGQGWDSVIPLPYLVLLFLSKNLTGDTGPALLLQVLVMASAVSYSCRVFFSRIRISALVALLISCLPSVAMVTISIWKDALFVAFYLLLISATIVNLRKNRQGIETDYTLVAILILAAGSMRLNGWLLVLPMVVYLIWVNRHIASVVIKLFLASALSVLIVLIIPSAIGSNTNLALSNSLGSFVLDESQIWVLNNESSDVFEAMVPMGTTSEEISSSVRCQAWDSLWPVADLSTLAEKRKPIVESWISNLIDHPLVIIQSRICRAAPNIFPIYSDSIWSRFNIPQENSNFPVYKGQWNSPGNDLGTKSLINKVTKAGEMAWLTASQDKYTTFFWWGGFLFWIASITFLIGAKFRVKDEDLRVAFFFLTSSVLINGAFAVSNDFRYIVPMQILSILIIVRGWLLIIESRNTVSVECT